jgi:hypothetical protein
MANVHVAELPDAPSSKLDCVSEIGHWWLCEASTTPSQNPLLDIGPNKANMPICPGHPRTTSWLEWFFGRKDDVSFDLVLLLIMDYIKFLNQKF